MKAIYKREMLSYFTSPVGYVFIAVFYFFAGFYFFGTTLMANTTDLSNTFSSMFSICIFMIPLLTMRLLSEERKNKTEQALLSAPVSLTGLVMGKYFAALTVFCIGTAQLLVFSVIISFWNQPDWPVVIGHFLGMLLLGASLISVGLLISSLTENQVVAAVGSFTAGLLLVLIDALYSIVRSPTIKKIITAVSFNDHYLGFTQGILRVEDILFFLSVCAVLLFFTVRILDQRRWY